MADRFFTTDRLQPGEYTLTGPEAHHLAAVRRFQTGDRVTLFNGDGNDYTAEVIGVAKKSVSLNILAAVSISRELSFPLVVASALPKGDRADFLVEKLTELGVTRLVPIVTSRSIVAPKASTIDKLQRAVIEASKQCGRNRLMQVDPPHKWESLLTRADLPTRRFVLHTSPGSISVTPGEAAIAIGPEGGFTPDEIAGAGAAGWGIVNLGSRTLRVETAAVAAAAILGVGVGSQ